MNCFRFLGFNSFEQVNQLTIPEYLLLMEAVQLKQVDLDYRNHLQAFLNFSVKAEKKTGKGKSRPVFTKFKKFYNYDEQIAKVKVKVKKAGSDSSKFPGIGKLMRKEG